MSTFITIIGSRQTPSVFLDALYSIAKGFALVGYTLRSGGADGADSIAEQAFKDCNAPTQIFLPWKGFNGNPSELFEPPHEAVEIVKKIHPAFDKLSQGACRLHMRNCQQILGTNLDSPTDLVVCYTKGGLEIGGTATAIKLAKMHNIPVINLG